MSLIVLKAGVSDTFQDNGRYGYQHLGINPGGVMDIVAMQVANALVGNDLNETVLEMHFPAAEIMFESDVLIALSGADFAPVINDAPFEINQPLPVKHGSTVKFKSVRIGSRIYLAVKGGFLTDKWLSSGSTNLKVQMGGFSGRQLKKGDVIPFNSAFDSSNSFAKNDVVKLPWSANVKSFYHENTFRILPGEEFKLLDDISKPQLIQSAFTISNDSDRMGYRLNGASLKLSEPIELLSSAVSKGTIQLLHNGQLIVLMADHQTTGGYPRVGHIISADISSLAQKKPGEKICFEMTDINTAESLLQTQYKDLLQLQNACNFRLAEYLNSK
jgi:antagonist of KipI